MIEVISLHKKFDQDYILNDISTVFEKGKTNLIIGQSGSGKTVLLKCLLGLYNINSGEISYDGVHSSEMDSNNKLELDMLTQLGIDEKNKRALKFIERVNLSDSLNKLPSELSGGMQKRVAIARAVVMNPKYLFCDEPNSGLDPKTAIVIDKLINEITKEYGITTIINSHDMNSVIEIGEKIIFLKDGNKIWQGNNKSILNSGNKEVNEFVYSSKLVQKLKGN